MPLKEQEKERMMQLQFLGVGLSYNIDNYIYKDVA